MLKEHHLYRFAEFTIDPVAKVLFRDGAPVQMTRKAVETLLVLVEHPGQVLTKEEIMSAVWPDRVVEEGNLAQNIAVIRKTLGAAKGSPAYIATFPGRGYRLEGPVSAGQVTTAPPAESPAAPAIESVPAAPKQITRWPLISIAALVVAVIVIGFLATRRPAVDSLASLPVIAATRLPGKEYQPAISPDGQSIAFLWVEESSNVPAVWMVKRGETSPRQVSQPGRHYSSPAWSSDSRELAYLGLGKGGTEILVSSVSGGHERLITTLTPPDYGFDNRLLDWSPDGKLLVVSHAPAPGRPPLLMLVSVASGETQSLTHPVPDVAGDIDPRFSPDGKRVSFIRLLHRSRQEIFSLPVGGGEPVQMTRLGRRISSHDWLHDGRTILASSDHAGEFRLWRLSADRAESAPAPKPVNIRGEFPIQLSVARKSEALVYSMLHQDRNIWRLDLEDRTWKRVIASTMQDASPVYSPTGDRIAFRSDRSGEEQLWVASAGGSNPVQITHGNVKPSVGRWAPDGRSLVFNDPQTSEIYLVALESSGAVVKKLGATGVHPVFSTDGAWVFAGGAKLVRIPVGGGPPVTIADTRGEALSTSRDGNYLYFVREPNDTALWRIALSGATAPEKVLEGIVPGCTSCWSLAPDGVYYLGVREDSFDRQAVFFRSFDGKGPPRLIAEYPQPLWPLGSGPFSLSPDRRYLLCVRVDPSNTDAMLVVPFR
jgi:Tol biopolymer transport system component/DNA-binding winged helix-turn-helix (wHTH) protein